MRTHGCARSFLVAESNPVGVALSGRVALFNEFKLQYRGLTEDCALDVLAFLAFHRDVDYTSNALKEIESESIRILRDDLLQTKPADHALVKRFTICASVQARLERQALIADPNWTVHLLEVGAAPSGCALAMTVKKLAAKEPDIVKCLITTLGRTFPLASKERAFICSLLRRTPLYPWKLSF